MRTFNKVTLEGLLNELLTKSDFPKLYLKLRYISEMSRGDSTSGRLLCHATRNVLAQHLPLMAKVLRYKYLADET